MRFTNSILRRHSKWPLLVGHEPPDTYISNGATLAPDILWGIDLRPAAHFHDYGYSGFCPGTHTEEDRYWVDQQFLQNLQTLGLSRTVASIYYYRVRFWGHLHYEYDDGCEPSRTLGFWFRLLIGRYVTW